MPLTGPDSLVTITGRDSAGLALVVTRAAPGAGLRWVVKRLAISVATTTSGGGVTWLVRDGATGVGTVIWQATLSALNNSFGAADVNDLHLPLPTQNNAVTIDASAAGVAAANEVHMTNAQLYTI